MCPEPRRSGLDVLAGPDAASGEVRTRAELSVVGRVFREEHLVVGMMDRVPYSEGPEGLAGDRPDTESLGDGPCHAVVAEPRNALRSVPGRDPASSFRAGSIAHGVPEARSACIVGGPPSVAASYRVRFGEVRSRATARLTSRANFGEVASAGDLSFT